MDILEYLFLPSFAASFISPSLPFSLRYSSVTLSWSGSSKSRAYSRNTVCQVGIHPGRDTSILLLLSFTDIYILLYTYKQLRIAMLLGCGGKRKIPEKTHVGVKLHPGSSLSSGSKCEPWGSVTVLVQIKHQLLPLSLVIIIVTQFKHITHIEWLNSNKQGGFFMIKLLKCYKWILQLFC